MPLEYKAIKAATMGVDGRTVTGIFAVHGNVDSGDGWSSRDRTHPNLFGDFLVDGRNRAKFLWQHQGHNPPIATIDRMFEVSAADLPPAVKAYAPDATGGVAVTRTYLDTPRANEVLAGLVASAITEMSYAYEATRWDYEEPDDDARLPIRNIYAAKLYDVSDVTWGMNPATSADGAKHWSARPVTEHADAVKAEIDALLERLRELKDRRGKDGRVLSTAIRERLSAHPESLRSVAEDLDDLLRETEPKAAPNAVDAAAISTLFAQYQHTLATINGVRL